MIVHRVSTEEGKESKVGKICKGGSERERELWMLRVVS